MKYKGQELQEITAPHIFNPPKPMLVWDGEWDEPKIKEVWGIAPPLAGQRFPVMGTVTNSNYKHCAEIPKPKRATYLQLAEWIAKGNGVFLYGETVRMNITFLLKDENDVLEAGYKIRPFGAKEWVEPTLENMGME